MNLTELSKLLDYSENTFKRSFNRTCESLKKNKGIIVHKTGVEPNADYSIEYDDSLIIPKKSTKIEHFDLIGQKFGHLTVIKDSGERFHRGVVWTCQCDCGTVKNIPGQYLKSGHNKTCGRDDCPYNLHYDDITGQRFGRLVAIKPTELKDGSHMYWLCQCDCGNVIEAASNHLKRGDIQSCGCIKTSIGEENIQKTLEKNNISYLKEVKFPDLKNSNNAYLRYDFAILENNKIIRLIEFDGIQHFEEQNYFTHSLEETKKNDIIKNEYAKKNNFPLVRIPYWERDNITLDLIMGDKYLL